MRFIAVLAIQPPSSIDVHIIALFRAKQNYNLLVPYHADQVNAFAYHVNLNTSVIRADDFYIIRKAPVLPEQFDRQDYQAPQPGAEIVLCHVFAADSPITN